MAGVQSIERAFAILRALSLGAVGVTDLSQRTGLPKSTVSRMLSTLELERAVIQLEDGSYKLGEAIYELGIASRDDQTTIEVARPHMIELMQLTGEAVGLNRMDGQIVRTLLQVDDPESSVVVRDWTDEPTPAHAVSAGIAIMAHSSKAAQRAFLEHDFEPHTPRTMTDSAELRGRFEQVRIDGFAWAFREFTNDSNSVAAPIITSQGSRSLALHIHGPSFRFPGDRNPDVLGTRVAETAERIETQLASG